MIVLGRVSGLHGVQGWVKLYSYTEPRENLLSYRRLQIQEGGQWRPVELLAGRRQGKALVAQFAGVREREQARTLIGCDLGVPREALPPLAPDTYYWTDLVGLAVVTVAGQSLGRVDHLLETGANDVLVVAGERERLIPFVQGQVIAQVDLAAGEIRVHWDPDF